VQALRCRHGLHAKLVGASLAGGLERTKLLPTASSTNTTGATSAASSRWVRVFECSHDCNDLDLEDLLPTYAREINGTMLEYGTDR
jgi:hypothetical protein